MKKISIINAITLFLVVMFISVSLFQCRKTGDLISGLDRSFKGSADSTLYTSFYDNHVISTADVPADVNDSIKVKGIQTIIHEYCGTSNCHGGPIKPRFNTYAEIMQFVSPGSPENSRLWQYLTTNDFDQAMPPVNSNKEMTITEKSHIYNWILNGAKEKPDLNDFRPAAIALIVTGCGSVNCHNQATAAGAWARKGLFGSYITPSDTSTYVFTDQATQAVKLYCLLDNKEKLDAVWTSYKDSVKKFYSDTILYADFRPFKTFAAPWVMPTPSPSIRGPLNSYDDIIMDVMYPKNIRSNSSVVYTNPSNPLLQYYVKTNFLNSNDCFIRRIDSTLIYSNPVTGIAASVNGSMAWDDGGLKPSEVALIKAWYFGDPNIPEVWKYGVANAGIFKYRKTGNIIRQ